MDVATQVFYAQKSGNHASDYEDAFSLPIEESGASLSFAVADGATESSFSGTWARILVDAFGFFAGANFGSSNIVKVFRQKILKHSYSEWRTRRLEYIRLRETQQEPLKWYEEPSVEAGALATFLGLHMTDDVSSEGGKWHAIAAGDSCLFQIRDEEVIEFFPLQSSLEFNNTPLLVNSNPIRNREVIKGLKTRTGTWRADDQFYLMTDAVAQWFLREVEDGEMPWHILTDLETTDEREPFSEWIERLRESHKMRNDDLTVMRIDILPRVDK